MPNKRVRIAILGTRGIPAQYGGFETFAEQLATRLVREGHEVTVCCEKGGDYTADTYKGVRLEYVPAPHLGPLSIVWFDTICMLKAARRHDLIYLLGYGAGSFAWVSRLFGTPIWTNMDGLEWKRSKWPWYGRLYLRFNEWCAAKFSSGMIADSEGIREYLHRQYGLHHDIKMIPYGAEIISTPPERALLSAFQVSADGYYLVVCRLEPENHVLEIIQGFKASKTTLELVIVGNSGSDTPYVRELKEIAGRRVRFVGTCYDKARLEALRFYSFAYFHGHSVGGTNPSLLEALGCGNLIIAHDNVFNREVAGDAGSYFNNSSDIPRLIEAVEKLNDVERASCSAAASQRIRDHYTWESVTTKYMEMLEPKCVSRKARKVRKENLKSWF